MMMVLQTGTGEEDPVLLYVFFFPPFALRVEMRKRKECTKWCVCARVGAVLAPCPFLSSVQLEVWACWGT